MRRPAVLIVIGVALAVARHASADGRCSLREPGDPCRRSVTRAARTPEPTDPRPTPWLDEGASPTGFAPVLAGPANDRRWESLAGVGGVYLAFSTWAYFAWYHDVEALPDFEYGDKDGYFGRNTYAGGADKAGHAWANMVLARAGSRVLRWGGWSDRTSAILASSLAWSLFLGVEVKDGFYYKFSYGDMYANTTGALLGAALELVPRLDRLIDFRVAYYPSPEYRGLWRGEYYGTKAGNSLNIAEDYSGETYYLALHLGALAWPAATPRPLAAVLDYADVGLAFATRRYKPDAPPDADTPHQQLYLGVAIDLQKVMDRLLARHATSRKISHGVLEVLTPPYSILPVAGWKRYADAGAVGPQ